MIDPDGGIRFKARLADSTNGTNETNATDVSNATYVEFGSAIPEPPTLFAPPAGRAGPSGSLAVGWPLENLVLRMAGVVKGFTYGRALVPNTNNSE